MTVATNPIGGQPGSGKETAKEHTGFLGFDKFLVEYIGHFFAWVAASSAFVVETIYTVHGLPQFKIPRSIQDSRATMANCLPAYKAWCTDPSRSDAAASVYHNRHPFLCSLTLQ